MVDRKFQVKDLLQKLLQEGPEAYVFVSSDEEGNQVSPIDLLFGSGTIGKECHIGDENGPTFIEGDDFIYPYNEDEFKKEVKGKPYIVLYPTI